MECKKIAVVGRSLSNPKWEDLFDMLDDGVESGKICYQKYNVDTMKTALPDDTDACIWIATMPKEKKHLPYIHLQVGASEEEIVDRMQGLVASLFKKEEQSVNIENPIADIPVHSSDGVTCELSVLNGLVVEYDGKSFRLSKEDMDELTKLLGICKEYNFVVKDIILDDKV